LNESRALRPAKDEYRTADAAAGHARTPAQGAPMESRGPALPRLTDTISEIAAILGEGFLRLRKGRRLPDITPDRAAHESQSEEFEAFTENRLDCSGHRSLHAENG
jgi:hypothetical protein